MIVVIADDLTGAAELAGLGYRYNLLTEITTNLQPQSQADLLVIATNTRSLSCQEAQTVMETIGAGLQHLRSTLVFKKIDSVLRGHVLAEINVLKTKLQRHKALIIPANPDKGRTVESGMYLLQGQPLHLSHFSQDPEYPITASQVTQMLGAAEGEVQVLKPKDKLPAEGIIIGEVATEQDLQTWSKKIDGNTLLAGAAGFFAALLATLQYEPSPAIINTAPPQEPFLVVWGSTYDKSRQLVTEMKAAGFPVSYMPEALTSGAATRSPAFRQWMQDTMEHIKLKGRAGLAVNPAGEENHRDPQAIRTMMAEAVAYLSEKVAISEYLVEGGATAAAIIRQLDIQTMYPIAELAPGVTRMRVKGRDRVWFTLKPGSYQWPAHLLQPVQME